ncbi:hypothetical protein J4G37_42145, partial [Microvirga sp. 3-52]|nr:hypothetical protein [Microvirga sp. 3-52]
SWAMHMDTLGPTIFLGKDGGLKLTTAGSGPWSGVWDGGIGSMSIFHDTDKEQTETIIPLEEHTLNIFDEKVRDFVVAIQEGKPAPIPGEEILVNQAIIDAIFRSSREGREVEVQLPEL